MQKNLKSNSKIEEPYKATIVAIFALVGMFICTTMALIGVLNGNYPLASTLFVASLIYLIGFYICKKHNNVLISSAIILYSLYTLMFYLVFTGGVEQTGPLWIFIVAPVSVFIHGLKRGLLDLVVFIIIIALIMYIPTDLSMHATYPETFKLRLIYSFITIVFLSALYEYTREFSLKQTLELSRKYEQLAHIDPLTSLSNRRAALDILKREQSRIARNKAVFSVLICDVDKFKHINDKYGHNAGDAVLVELAKIFTEQIREQDMVSRWGGEEFLFILPQTKAKNAFVIAEKIRLKVAESPILYQNIDINLNVSIGIAQCESTSNIDELINRADNYLYQAKESGRNQTQPQMT